MSLDGLSILVSGGGSGIGRAATLAYLGAGARVTVVERSPAHAAALRTDAAALPLTVVEGDATSSEVLAEAVRTAVRTGGRLDRLTCCVGVFDHYASIRDLPVADLVAAAQEIWHSNVVSALAAVRTAWPELERARGSAILTLSESAFHPVGGGVLYGSSKWALRGVVQHLAVDLAPAVRVNGVAPGGTSGTKFSGLSALGGAESTVDARGGRSARIAATTLLQTTATPEDHAGAFLYLADPVAARVVTGVVINTDGGRAPVTAKTPEELA
ncbi:NAD(P)-dependent dehydrogenase (short-subunit alcohol dehydrogenase family) [Amycolatopsis bartoniae]|uniref:3-(Cis-5,6-dihydroxycyclohexa-1, 3-dien-1-yl)propanoate dehydrogenase n=1 Tax=Amycolatopsis bartoniae TaxID=941986 RepID=A0A8H9IM85_9PSEU|nr:SDR family NAD(P)-dependent oxidoreductase [Amycolatopsis bartoniae]MBB2938105.1 NAD(P)-dependent dehydrogenase (short-subunit alcohol dehydrogenase family) [Amycolatopsis bartoniae]TVT01257.1 SDR family oxidoreductase [Amycolatopsis bartoniae]GHF32713.1 3-(cis-5,6-dihydroxycyclohexa-1, 3-dien-1-yl)propanoate dehydrogenase [Amycolatopsis bartoniae]